MRLLIQRVKRASVIADSVMIGQIAAGFLVLCGIKKEDKPEAAKKMVEKCVNLRVFEDEQGKMNLSLLDTHGELLVVSQFTLYADCGRGRRPGFDNAMPPDPASQLYEILLEEFRKFPLKVEGGVFGAKMLIELVNDGPVTILLDDADL